MTVSKKRFAIQGLVHAPWQTATCELYTLANYRLVRGSRFMEYALEDAAGGKVRMVRWVQTAKPRLVDAMDGEGNLGDLGELAKATEGEIVEWASMYGLVGFRNVGRKFPQQLGLTYSIVPGVGAFHAYEPLDLVWDGARVAAATTALYAALRNENSNRRVGTLQKLIHINPGTRVGDQIEMSVLGIRINHLFRPARTSAQWTDLGLGLLSDLTEQYLDDEFRLYWYGPARHTRRIGCGWKVRSLFGALFLKLASRIRESRNCSFCSKPLDVHVRSHTQTCSASCRKRLQRYRTKSKDEPLGAL